VPLKSMILKAAQISAAECKGQFWPLYPKNIVFGVTEKPCKPRRGADVQLSGKPEVRHESR
jgi:hypothetical protein